MKCHFFVVMTVIKLLLRTEGHDGYDKLKQELEENGYLYNEQEGYYRDRRAIIRLSPSEGRVEIYTRMYASTPRYGCISRMRRQEQKVSPVNPQIIDPDGRDALAIALDCVTPLTVLDDLGREVQTEPFRVFSTVFPFSLERSMSHA